ncbi:MAG TPA: hypothetical protein VEA79_11195 [Phenylobacterium sp.]|nr:hypothetical protein [Phenylobacterium sp.]
MVGFAGALLASSAYAQSASTSQATGASEDEAGVEELVVTGSRIRRSEFTSASPVQVINAEQVSVEGIINTTEILQTSSIAASARQLDNQFTGFVVVSVLELGQRDPDRQRGALQPVRSHRPAGVRQSHQAVVTARHRG